MKIKHILIITVAVLALIAVIALAQNQKKGQTPAVTPTPASAATPAPAAVPAPAHNHPHSQNLTPASPHFADSLKKNFRVDPCCASSLDECAKQKPQCHIAKRLNAFVDWLDSMSHHQPITEEKISEMLQTRHASFADPKRYTNDEQGWPVVGDRNAPLTIVMYFSGTCPVCKTNFRALHYEITAGKLKGKTKIVAKPFGAGLANRAIAAAHELGRFSDFMLELANAGGRVDESVIYAIVDRLYLDPQRFTTILGSPELLTRVEAATAEGEKNGVTHVPTYFIAGQRYNSSIDPRWVVDAIELAAETKK
ncbi:MAG: DsbA family protein [Chitinispirillia bacterium]|nr:DsbA family protein [Chitinispirillia bacterium]MCL2241599.1 DsbA family protein [Chitinispirillia bacterium]